MSVTVAEANRIAAELDARMNGYGDHALATAQALATSRCGGCSPNHSQHGFHRPGCPEAA